MPYGHSNYHSRIDNKIKSLLEFNSNRPSFTKIMRVEPFTVGSYVHVYNRGNRKADIVRDIKDKWRVMQALRFFNDSHLSQNILRAVLELNSNQLPNTVFEAGWPPNWPEKDPLVKILCYFLGPNHFHLLLKEIIEGGISKFMQKLGTGLTNYFNLKYQEVGTLFQGSYKGRTLKNNQRYLEYLSVYIQVKNVLELFPGGFKKALENLDEAFKFVEEYQFSSYRDAVGLRKSLIIDRDILGKIFPTPEAYKQFARDTIKGMKYEVLSDLLID